MAQTTIKWLKTNCPICGRKFQHPEFFKPATCADPDCVQKYLHPELYKVRR